MDQPWTLINPEIVDIGNEDFEVWDDCFSFPNLLVRVSRAYRIRVRYQDLKGEWSEMEVEGDRAELLQHEIDHLDGVLAVDRPQGLDPFCLREEWHRLYGPNGRYGPPEPRSATYAGAMTSCEVAAGSEPPSQPDEHRLPSTLRQPVLESDRPHRRLGTDARPSAGKPPVGAEHRSADGRPPGGELHPTHEGALNP